MSANTKVTEPIASQLEMFFCEDGVKQQSIADFSNCPSSQTNDKSRSKVRRVSLAAQLLPGPAMTFAQPMDTGFTGGLQATDMSQTLLGISGLVDNTTNKSEMSFGQFSKVNRKWSQQTYDGLRKSSWVPCQQTETSATSDELNSSIAAKKEDSKQDSKAFKRSGASQIFGVPSIFSLPCDLDFLDSTCSSEDRDNVYQTEVDASQIQHEPANQSKKGAGKDCKDNTGKSLSSTLSSASVEFGVPQNQDQEQILSKFRAIWSKNIAAKELLTSPEKRTTKVLLHEQLGLPVPQAKGDNKENQSCNRQRVNLAAQLGKWNGVENILRQRVCEIGGPNTDKAQQSSAVSAFVMRQIVKR